jgi:FkbM family methyltransferase
VRPASRTVAILAILVLAVAGYVWREPLRLTFLVLAGRSPHCPIERAVLTAAHLRQVTALKDEILAASHLVETDPDGYELWDTPKGRYWIPRGNQYGLPFNLAEQASGIYTLGDIRVREGAIVLDCGASVGVFTREALAAGAGLVVAIEPSPINLECLRRNLADEAGQGRVIIYPKGVWDKEDTLTLYVDPEHAAAASFVHHDEAARPVQHVPLTTIDHLVAELNLPAVDFIKMDIEGAEPRAIAGARRTLVRYQPRLALCAYHEPDHPMTIPAAVFRANPDYRVECGDCEEQQGHLRPIVQFFE